MPGLLSRRQFIRRTGAFAAMFGLVPAGRVPEAARGAAAIAGTSLGDLTLSYLHGRAFTRAQVVDKPGRDGTITGLLMPDSVYPIQGLSEDGWWYRVADGFVPREALQPILPYSPPPVAAEKGYFEVVAPLTTVREYCSGLAPILVRVAFGAVVYVHDHLTDDHGQVWYAVSGSQRGTGPFGWASAAHFRQWVPAEGPLLRAPTLWIDTSQHKLTLYEGDTLVGETVIYCGSLLRGMGRLVAPEPEAWTSQLPYVRSWAMSLVMAAGKPSQVYGAFWHNRFGLAGDAPQVELPTFAARWLYGMARSLLNTGTHPGVSVVIE